MPFPAGHHPAPSSAEPAIFPSVKTLLGEGRRRLENRPGLDAALESRVLLRRVLNLTEMEVLAYPERPVSMGDQRRYFRRIGERSRGVPFAYVIGEREFWSIPLTVGPGVLVPRPETELLVETVLDLAVEKAALVVEIGTGSGAVAIALAKEMAFSRILATDRSRRALRYARANASRHGAGNIVFAGGELFNPLRRAGLRGGVDILLSNPPYVAEKDWRKLDPEVRDHEPKSALVPGPTGLEMIRSLVSGAPEFLRPGGRLVMEIGRGQSGSVRGLFDRKWDSPEVRKDLRGILRVVWARLR